MKQDGTAVKSSFLKAICFLERFLYLRKDYYMSEKKPYYITTAIAYTSGKPHIGNTYEIVLTDAIARFKREQGYDVRFMTGTDEHGQKIEDKARSLGKTPQEFVDGVAKTVKETFDQMNVSYNKFIRTTDDYHVKQVQKIFKKLYEQGDIYKGEYEGMYCKECEAFYTNSQLVDGKCPDCHGDVYPAKEEAYFFRMSKYADRLKQYIEDHPHFIEPESRKNEMINNFINAGLQDLCVSRTSFKWGVPVDFDDKHVVYVWIDALSNYITGLGYDVDGNSDPMFSKYWPADVHIIGKDILRFHTIYWPIMLMALDLPLPKQIFGHPWLLMGTDKMSKSRGNVIYADQMNHYFGVDATRYFLLHEMPFAQDGTITWDLVIERINSDLANVLGNLVSRTISMENKYFDGNVTNPNVSEAIDDELIALANQTRNNVANSMETLHVGEAIDQIFKLLKRCNKYIDETAPWILAKEEASKQSLATVLYNLLDSIRISAILLKPYLPETSEKILTQLNTQATSYDQAIYGQLETNIKVCEKPEILFARIDAPAMLEQITNDLLPEDQRPHKHKSEITIDDFSKLELMVGQVIECKKHPKADKLLVSQVDMGRNEVRQIVSGIAEYVKPEDFVGKKVIVVTNLKPIKLKGVLSQGMILAGDNASTLEVLSVNNLNPGDLVH